MNTEEFTKIHVVPFLGLKYYPSDRKKTFVLQKYNCLKFKIKKCCPQGIKHVLAINN